MLRIGINLHYYSSAILLVSIAYYQYYPATLVHSCSFLGKTLKNSILVVTLLKRPWPNSTIYNQFSTFNLQEWVWAGFGSLTCQMQMNSLRNSKQKCILYILLDALINVHVFGTFFYEWNEIPFSFWYHIFITEYFWPKSCRVKISLFTKSFFRSKKV